MGKRPRLRASNADHCMLLYSADTSLGWRIVRRVTKLQGERMVAESRWRPATGGYQVVANFACEQVLPSRGSAVSISPREILMNAGCYGASRTAGLCEDERLSRHARYDAEKILPPEDGIERAMVKVKQWPYPASRIDDGSGEPVYGDKAVRVYPNPS